jgi:hypothetical protein
MIRTNPRPTTKRPEPEQVRLGRSLADVMTETAEDYAKQIERVRMYCGTPDAAQGCRNILEETKELDIKMQLICMVARIAELEKERDALVLACSNVKAELETALRHLRGC